LIRAGDPKPAPGSPRFVRDRRRLQIFVILVYLLYTVYDADWQLRQAGSFYQDLGVAYDATDKAIQSRFRRLYDVPIPCELPTHTNECRTVQYHPDKVSGADRAAVEAIYVRLQLARDALVDPAKRFAYDRFGSDILQWQHAKTIRDYVFTGVQSIAVYYVGTGGALVLLSILGYLQSGKFWRYLVMTALFLIELHTMTRPSFPAVLTSFVNPILATTRTRPPYLPFQMLALLRKLAVTFFIAMTQLSPLLKAPRPEVSPDGSISPQQLKNLDDLTMATDLELTRLMRQEMTPFLSDEASFKSLKDGLREWLVRNTIQNDPEVRNAIGRVFERRRVEVQQVAS